MEPEPESTASPGGEGKPGGDAVHSPGRRDEPAGSALIRFLQEHRSEWAALSAKIRALAGSTPTAITPPEAREIRENWLLLADYLAHSDCTTAMPSKVRRFLESDARARAAQAAFAEALTHRDDWLKLAKEIARGQSRRRSEP